MVSPTVASFCFGTQRKKHQIQVAQIERPTARVASRYDLRILMNLLTLALPAIQALK